MWASSASRLWECWLPDERPAPNCVRTVSAICAAPPVMNGSFAAWLSSWSRHTPTKSRYISSTTGRIPAMAAPTPRPMIAVSEIGVSRTRSPKRSRRPRVSPKTLPPAPTSMPGDEHAARRSASSASSAARMASIVRNTGASAGGGRRLGALGPRAGHEVEQRRPGRAGLRAGPPRRRRRAPAPPTPPAPRSASSPTPAARSRAGVGDERVARLPLLHLLGRAVALRVALVVAVPPVGGRLDDHRAAAGPHGRRPPRPWPTAVATTSLPSTAT